MLKAILFNDKRFSTKNEENFIQPITDNIVILCANYKLMYSLAEEIVNTINGKAEYNDYDCDDNDVGAAKYALNFGLQKVIDINGQRITLCLEPAMVYKAKRIEDIWFIDWSGKDADYKELIYPMTDFKGSQEVWDKGLDEVYRTICNGGYGCYDGSWVKLNPQKKAVNIQWDTDGEDVTLPTEILIPFGMEDDEEAISDYLSESTGFCHEGFDIL